MADSVAAAERTQQQHKRMKLFHAMRDSASADVLPALQECHYPQFYQVALAMEQMLQTWALERGAPNAETTRAALLRWEWSPATKDGRPVKTWVAVPVPFALK